MHFKGFLWSVLYSVFVHVYVTCVGISTLRACSVLLNLNLCEITYF